MEGIWGRIGEGREGNMEGEKEERGEGLWRFRDKLMLLDDFFCIFLIEVIVMENS